MIRDFANECERMSARLEVALELHQMGVAMMRRNLQREHPHATAAEIDQRIAFWLSDSSGSEAPFLRRRGR